MPLADDLLNVATQLAQLDAGRPRQATLRRAVSTAYYALFHLLIDEAAAALVVGTEFRNLVGRAFNHGDMKKVCDAFRKNALTDSLTALVSQVPNDLRDVASAFVDLQERRHQADYDRSRRFSRQDTQDLLARAGAAFASWLRVRTTPEAKVFLVALLLSDRWKR